MTDREKNITLREMARAHGLCDKWYNEWSDDSTLDECLDRFVRGFDFYVNTDFIPLDFARKNLDKELLHKHHIYIDEDVNLEADSHGYYIFLGKCKGKFVVDGLWAVTVYVRHDSDIEIHSSNGARVFVTLYDDSMADCHQDDWGIIKKHEKK